MAGVPQEGVGGVIAGAEGGDSRQTMALAVPVSVLFKMADTLKMTAGGVMAIGAYDGVGLLDVS